MDNAFHLIVAVAITTGGVVTGLLFAFSNFVMQALDELHPEHSMFAMQRVNEKIINPMFMTMFLGTPLLCIYIVLATITKLDDSGHFLLLLGALAYLIGPFGITMRFNVPLNNKFALEEPCDAEDAWPKYKDRWQRWNHIRTYIGIVSILLLALGLGAST